MAVVAGVNAFISTASGNIANVDDWTLNIKGENVDTTPFGASGSWHQRTATLKDWDVKLKGRLDTADAAQYALINGGPNTAVTVTCFTGSANNANWSGSALVSSIIPQATATGVEVVEYDFVGNGTLTFGHT